MVPTLFGRIQTRLFMLALVGGVVTAAVAPLLPVDAPAAARYQSVYVVLAAVAVLGVGWELIYHVLMQWRWEKDWPTLFGLVTIVPEGVLAGFLATGGHLPGLPGPVPLPAFAVHFTVVWLAVWLFVNGPVRVPFIRWRFRGGRLL
ncbi:hypothetical protein HNP84_002011 [Thermocatellispora tengchongensis]|uniref:Uncharacterized protein n=1 Tax=Thermocatellispora tengchongensis TaxID=1073253 RepID=A0A840P8G6_9ACTN|nr:hypothetical protein [Thermocatellispora tengchongensis]MBB5132295.1 hypothetical protein [Thermocatellispora tengchongensis]